MFGGPPIYMPYQPPVTQRQPPPRRPEPAQPVKPRAVAFAPPELLGIQLDVSVPDPGDLGIQLK